MRKVYFFKAVRQDMSLREVKGATLAQVRAKARSYLLTHKADWVIIRVRNPDMSEDDVAEMRKYGDRVFYDAYGIGGTYGEVYPEGNMRAKVWADG